MLVSLINEKTVYGLTNPYDGDFITKPTKEILNTTNHDKETNSYDSDLDITTLEGNAYEIVFENEEIGDGHHNKDVQSVETNKTNWSKFKASDLQQPTTTALTRPLQKNLSTPRRRTMQSSSLRRPTTVRTLTSSLLSEKYAELVNKKLHLLECYQREHELRMRSLELDIKLKEKQLLQE